MADIQEKISKLLKLADPENGATESEAILAAERAQELSMKHGIDIASLTVQSDYSADNAFIDLESGKWRRTLANKVAKSFGAKCVWVGGGYNSHDGKLHVFAPKGTIDPISSTFRSLENWVEYESAIATSMREDRSIHGRSYRNSWILGAINRIGKKLEGKASRIKQDVVKSDDNKAALVKIGNSIDLARDNEYPRLSKSQSSRVSDYGAYIQGQEAGNSADIGNSKLGNTRSLLNA